MNLIKYIRIRPGDIVEIKRPYYTQHTKGKHYTVKKITKIYWAAVDCNLLSALFRAVVLTDMSTAPLYILQKVGTDDELCGIYKD